MNHPEPGLRDSERWAQNCRLIIEFLKQWQLQLPEAACDSFERYVDSVNAFFDTEVFSVCSGPRNCFRIPCACGWSLSLMLPEQLAADACQAVLQQCVRGMVRHFEIQHGGLKKAEPL
jgi:hypothetical protein